MKIFSAIFTLFVATLLVSCSPNKTKGLPTPASSASTILISIDGFRYDYIEKHNAKNLQKLAEAGVRAKKTYPVFPSKTFPNHLSIVTGTHPNKHGILHNTFYDRELEATYKKGIGHKQPHWVQALPIWTLAEINNIKTATYHWPESEARIYGTTPSYFYFYNKKTPYRQIINQLVDWLKLPESTRPKLLVSYFALVDSMGHDFGPDAKQTHHAVQYVDELLGVLFKRIKEEVDIPVNLVIVSDHGMTNVYSKDSIIFPQLDTYEGFKVINGNTQLLLYIDDTVANEDKEKHITAQAKALEQKANGRYRVFTKQTFPKHWHFDHPTRTPDVMLDAIPPRVFKKTMENFGTGGTHGYDAMEYDEMGGLFIAHGPNFQSGKTIEPFSLVHIYPMLAELLHLTPPDNIDGDIKVLSPILINAETK